MVLEVVVRPVHREVVVVHLELRRVHLVPQDAADAAKTTAKLTPLLAAVRHELKHAPELNNWHSCLGGPAHSTAVACWLKIFQFAVAGTVLMSGHSCIHFFVGFD